MPRGEALLKKKTTYGLSPRQLIRLLAIGRKGGDAPIGASVSKTPAEILGGILSSTLPLDPDSPNSLPVVLDWTGRKVLSASGRKIGDLLVEPKTDLEILRGLKEYGKTLASGTSAKAKQVAATAIYYAAIASVLVCQQHKTVPGQQSYRSSPWGYIGEDVWASWLAQVDEHEEGRDQEEIVVS
jgi:hypothetical protein